MEIALKSADFNEAYGDLLDALLGSLGEELNGVGVSMTANDAKLAVTINKSGYIEKVGLKSDVKVTMTIEGENSEMNVSLDISGEYKNIGETVVVTPPADLDSYKEKEADDSDIF